MASALVAGGPAASAFAAADPPALCRDAARQAAAEHAVPSELMLAITEVETRKRFRGESGPWPWTLNIAGRGHWLASPASAAARAEAAIAAGTTSVDVGCFQLNWRWHGQAFPSVRSMLEPRRSARYAAQFLRGLYEETGDWMTAASYYHSRTPRHAARYRRLIAGALADAGEVDQVLAAVPRPKTAPRTEPKNYSPAPPPPRAAPRRRDAAEVQEGARATPGAVRLTALAPAAAPLIPRPR
ncbi:MAG: lytic transglycosylase domain-containing protein [Paracoccaceae bacterium]